MKNKMLIISLFIFFGLSNQSLAQTFIERASQEFCDCLEKNETQTMKASELCMESLYVDNLKELKQFYKVKRINEVDIEDFISKVMVDLYVNCPYAMDMLSNSNEFDQKKVVQKQKNLKCDDIKNGDFYYLQELNDTNDTIFLSITDKLYVERMNNGRNYSILNIAWKDDCKFDLEFIESNDIYNKELGKKINLYHYEILSNNDSSVILRSIKTNNPGQFKLIKID